MHRFNNECNLVETIRALNQIPQTQIQTLHVLGDLDTLEGVAHTQTADVESDLTRDVADPMVDVCADTEILMDMDEN